MENLKKDADQLKQLADKAETFQTVSKNLRDGNNGFFIKRMKRFKQRLLEEIKKK